MTDYKDVNRFPVEATRAQHERRSRIGDTLILAACLLVGALWGGFQWGWERRGDELAMPTVGACPESNPDQDVLEHTWTHRGRLIHRECLVIAKPIYAQPRYSARPPSTRM